MGKTAGEKASEFVGTVLGVVVMGAIFLGGGWIIGFRPIEWVMDFTSTVTATDAPTPRPAYVGNPIPVDDQPVDPPPPPQPELWSCGWDPTMNENWHDDILCTRGFERDRPLLLTDWDFVTYDDMMAAGADYEGWLNNR
ncbi:hypothetical protein LJR186_001475 [Microbacterium foliorum]